MPSSATAPATIGAAIAGRMIFCTTVSKLIAPLPAAIQVAPIRPPNRACDEELGRPKYQVTRFHRIAPTSPPKMIGTVIFESSTRPLEIVVATAVEMNAPTRLSTADTVTATLGLSAPVAMDVAIALAVSWKPLVKSNTNAVMITTTTRKDRSIAITSPWAGDVQRGSTVGPVGEFEVNRSRELTPRSDGPPRKRAPR